MLNFGVRDWHVFVLLEARMPPEQFADFFARLDPIRELREHIAHGHLLARRREIAREERVP